MSDQHKEEVMFRFRVPHDPTATDELRILAWYKDARIDMAWTDDGKEGTRNLNDLIATMPQVLRAVREEVVLRKDLHNVDAELMDLLDKEDGE